MSTSSTVYLTHHSHCDLGYTHDLPIVRELQRRFIDEALDLIERHADRGEAATFRWTCEVTAVVEHWLRTASSRQIERFVAASRRGQLEVCALWCNLTPLASLGQLAEMLAPMQRLRTEFGLPVRAAMNSDVNGFSWALTDLLRSAGITGLTMSINEHFGRAPQPFPGLFRWRTPTGDHLPVWNGPTYAHTAWLGFGADMATTFARLREYLSRQRSRGWAHPWLYMQITHPGPQNDNMGPLAHLSPWVAAFNERYGDEIRLVITTPSRFFDAVRAEAELAEVRTGEWNDWWSFGVGSTPFETTLFRKASQRLEEADLLALVGRPRNHAPLRATAQDALAHYIEHTWGADSSVHFPADQDSRIQARHKEQFAYQGFSYSRMLRRDGLSLLASRIQAPPGPAVVVYNPTAHPRRETLAIARRLLESHQLPPAPNEPWPAPRRWPVDGSYQHFVDRHIFAGQMVEEVGPVDVPPFGWRVVTCADQAKPAPELVFSGTQVSNGRLTLAWSPGAFGLASVRAAEREWVAAAPVGFGSLISEELVGENRSTIMRFDDSSGPVETRRPVWNPAPSFHRAQPTAVRTWIERAARSFMIVQEGQLPGTDGVTVTWQLSADHDDIEVLVTVRKRPDPRPHALYLALPFAMSAARFLVETPGLVIDPDHDVLADGCPWWSVQGGFAVGEDRWSACVATPDAPLVSFRKLPLGLSQIQETGLAGDGFAFLWLYNNYWETNFKADDSGVYSVRLRIALSTDAPSAMALTKTSALAQHPLAAHPLPEADSTLADWPAVGALFTCDARSVQVVACIPEAEHDGYRLLFANPTEQDGTVELSSGQVQIASAEQVAPDGSMLASLKRSGAGWKLTLASRSHSWVGIRVADTKGFRSDPRNCASLPA